LNQQSDDDDDDDDDDDNDVNCLATIAGAKNDINDEQRLRFTSLRPYTNRIRKMKKGNVNARTQYTRAYARATIGRVLLLGSPTCNRDTWEIPLLFSYRDKVESIRPIGGKTDIGRIGQTSRDEKKFPSEKWRETRPRTTDAVDRQQQQSHSP